MINTKYFLNLRSQKIIRFFGKSTSQNFSYQNKGPPSEEDIKKTIEFYDAIATKYLAAVNLMTLGRHKIWRRAIADNIEISDGIKILDAPAGTGLNTLKLLEKCKKHLRSELDFPITMFDINSHMMKIGQDNFKKLGYNENLVKFVEGDLHHLPFNDESFDVVITSLANRPGVNMCLVLKEINRILKPEGKIFYMDLCYSQNPTIIQRIYCNYIQFIASKFEKMIIGDLGTAEYVIGVICEVIAKTNLEDMLKEANFQKIIFKPMTLGIAGLTIASKV